MKHPRSQHLSIFTFFKKVNVKRREKYPKNTENFADEREEGTREIKIQMRREAANTGLGEG
jgi:hypothetical protein